MLQENLTFLPSLRFWYSVFIEREGKGVARLDGEQRDRVFNEMREMERRKTTTFGDTVYRLAFSKYESFGDWVYVMELKIDKKASPSHQRSGAKSRASR